MLLRCPRQVKLIFLAIAFCFNADIFASYAVVPVDQPALLGLTPEFRPLTIKGMKFYPDDPLKFDFLIDEGSVTGNDRQMKETTARLIDYFLVSLTMPQSDLWVNLSPDEADRIIPDALSLTGMGRDMLRQDYVLKQLAASLTYPDSESGKKYWDVIQGRGDSRIVQTSERPPTPSLSKRGSEQSFTKVWIMPGKAVVYTDKNAVYLGEATLKVVAQDNNPAMQSLIPLLEKEVNTGAHFACLRQMYHALVLASWFKRHLHDNLLNKSYSDQKKISGVDTVSPRVKEALYQKYLSAFKTGIYDYVKSERSGAQHAVPFADKITKRRYVCGGLDFTGVAPDSRELATLPLARQDYVKRAAIVVYVKLRSVWRVVRRGLRTAWAPVKAFKKRYRWQLRALAVSYLLFRVAALDMILTLYSGSQNCPFGVFVDPGHYVYFHSSFMIRQAARSALIRGEFGAILRNLDNLKPYLSPAELRDMAEPALWFGLEQGYYGLVLQTEAQWNTVFTPAEARNFHRLAEHGFAGNDGALGGIDYRGTLNIEEHDIAPASAQTVAVGLPDLSAATGLRAEILSVERKSRF